MLRLLGWWGIDRSTLGRNAPLRKASGMHKLVAYWKKPMCEPTTHRGAWRVTTTVNASWRRGSAGTATCLVEKCRLLGHPPWSGELAPGARVDPPSAADRAFPAGIPGKLIPYLHFAKTERVRT